MEWDALQKHTEAHPATSNLFSLKNPPSFPLELPRLVCPFLSGSAAVSVSLYPRSSSVARCFQLRKLILPKRKSKWATCVRYAEHIMCMWIGLLNKRRLFYISSVFPLMECNGMECTGCIFGWTTTYMNLPNSFFVGNFTISNYSQFCEAMCALVDDHTANIYYTRWLIMETAVDACRLFLMWFRLWII